MVSERSPPKIIFSGDLCIYIWFFSGQGLLVVPRLVFFCPVAPLLSLSKHISMAGPRGTRVPASSTRLTQGKCTEDGLSASSSGLGDTLEIHLDMEDMIGKFEREEEYTTEK